MKTKIISLAALIFMLPMVTLAADFRSNGFVAKTDKVKNLYLAGQDVSVNADVLGDLTTAGGTVEVNGNVENNIQAAGGTIILNGNTGRNVRLGGGTVIVGGKIREDLIVFGGQVTMNADSVVEGDLIVYGGTVALNGEVKGRIYGSGGDITINGTVGNDVKFNEIGTLKVGNSAAIGGILTYSSPQKGDISGDAKIVGETKFTKISKQTGGGINAGSVGARLFGAIGAFIAIYLLTRLFPKSAGKLLEVSFAKPLANLGLGFAILILVPVAGIITLITIVGAPVAVQAGMVYMACITIAGMLASLLTGSYIRKRLTKSKKFEINWQDILIGVLVVALLKSIPILGWLAFFVIFLIALGATADLLVKRVQLERK